MLTLLGIFITETISKLLPPRCISWTFGGIKHLIPFACVLSNVLLQISSHSVPQYVKMSLISFKSKAKLHQMLYFKFKSMHLFTDVCGHDHSTNIYPACTQWYYLAITKLQNTVYTTYAATALMAENVINFINRQEKLSIYRLHFLSTQIYMHLGSLSTFFL